MSVTTRTRATPLQANGFIARVLRGQSPSWSKLAGPDRAGFLAHASQHGTMALLFEHMHEREAWATWPQDVREALEARFKSSVAGEMLRTHHLQKLLQIYEKHDVRCLLMKGEALSRTCYSLLRLRDCGSRQLNPGFKNHRQAVHIPAVLVHLRRGGVSNISFSNRFAANRKDREAWRVNNIRPFPWTLVAKPLRKAGQWFRKS